MIACPNPEKMRYATQQAARTRGAEAQLRIGKRLYEYRCICGWHHLTSDEAAELPPREPKAEDVARLAHLPADDFTLIVSADVKGAGSTEDRLALRHPDNLTRWRWVLKALHEDATRQLRARADDTSFFGRDWRARTEHFRDSLDLRLLECHALRAGAQHLYSQAS